MAVIEYQPIGIFRCVQSQPVDSPRQASLAHESVGVVELDKKIPIDSLQDLAGFGRLWLVYDFHQNKTWKPKVRPPRGHSKRGVFATRSPYRPNSIGMSCVILDKIEGNKVFCKAHDLLDGTPILDIKPYVEFSDSFSGCGQGWLETIQSYSVHFNDDSRQRLMWLEQELGKPLLQTVVNQIGSEPLLSKSKRVKQTGNNNFVFSYRTWRIHYQITDDQIFVFQVLSGLSDRGEKDSCLSMEDRLVHKKFDQLYGDDSN